jgi:hypothetical protein
MELSSETKGQRNREGRRRCFSNCGVQNHMVDEWRGTVGAPILIALKKTKIKKIKRKINFEEWLNPNLK